MCQQIIYQVEEEGMTTFGEAGGSFPEEETFIWILKDDYEHVR